VPTSILNIHTFDSKAVRASINFVLGTIETLRQYLETLNIETRPLWKPLHQQPIFAHCQSYNNGISDRLFSTGLCLPSGSNLSEGVIENVILEIKKHLGV
jgi:dTDP-4-amino-4,6-dideoxygalactose transaminase